MDSRMQNIWIWIVIAVLVIGGGFWWWQSTQMPAMQPSDNMTGMDLGSQGAATSTAIATSSGVSVGATVAVGTAPLSASVTYNGSSFSPSTVTIAQGGTVTFTSTAGAMWVASGPHPIHNSYDGTTMQQHCAPGYIGAAPFDQCSPGTSFTFTFNNVGSWGYHDHLNASVQGTVIVQ